MSAEPLGTRGPAGPRGVADANRRHYASGEAVAGYSERPYHRLRQELACQLLTTALRASLPGREPASLSVLELGASGGTLSRQLGEAGFRPILADLEPEALMAAQRRGLPAACLDAGRPLPFADAAFHGVVMGELIEHLFDTRTVLAEVARVLVPGGCLVLTTPNLAPLQDRFRFLFGLAPRQVDPLHEYLYLHIRPFTYQSLVRALRGAGFGRFRLRSNYVVLRWGQEGRIEMRWLARLIPSLGGSLVISAIKFGETPVPLPP